MHKSLPSGPLQHLSALPAESPDTRKDPHRIPHGILRPLPQYLEAASKIGLNPEYLHRIASLSSGGLDTLPHNGAVLTLLAVSNCTHKESYLDICITTCIIPVVGSLLLALVWGIFI